MLALTGYTKAVSAAGSARALDAGDPLIEMPFRQLMLLMGLGSGSDHRSAPALFDGSAGRTSLRSASCTGLSYGLIPTTTAVRVKRMCVGLGAKGRGFRRVLFVLPAIIWVLNLETREARGQEYSVEGNLQIWVSAGSPAEHPVTGSFDFYAEIHPGRYKIRMSDIGKATNYSEYGFSDGAMYVFHHRRPTEIYAQGNVRKVTPRDFAPYYASVSNREIPPAEPSRPQFVWFAYASAPYFHNLSNSLALPIWSPEDPEMQRQPFEMFVYYKTSEAAPHLPISVDFINDGFYRSYNSSLKMLDVIRLSPPYDHGFTNAYYRVLETTNCGTLTVPASFLFQVYSSPINAGSIPTPRLVVRGQTLRVSDSPPEGPIVPQFTGVASVADWRQHRPAIQGGRKVELPYMAYPVTNSSWLDSNQLSTLRARIESKVQQRLVTQKALVAMPAWRIKLFRYVLAASIIPLLYFAWRTMKQSSRNRTQKQKGKL
jgi:hypothetical protein